MSTRSTATTKTLPKVSPGMDPTPKKGKREEPLTVAKAADLYFTTKAERLEMQHQVEELAEKEKSYKDFIINNLPKDSSGVAGHLAFAKIIPKVQAVVEDWDKFYAYIARTKRWDLLQKRLGVAAVSEFWDAGKTVPGVGEFHYKDVSITKVK